MKKFIIHTREVFRVTYLVEAENQEEAIQKWVETDDYETLDHLEYLCGLDDYGIYVEPVISEAL